MFDSSSAGAGSVKLVVNIVDNIDPINLGRYLESMHQVKFAISRNVSRSQGFKCVGFRFRK